MQYSFRSVCNSNNPRTTPREMTMWIPVVDCNCLHAPTIICLWKIYPEKATMKNPQLHSEGTNKFVYPCECDWTVEYLARTDRWSHVTMCWTRLLLIVDPVRIWWDLYEYIQTLYFAIAFWLYLNVNIYCTSFVHATLIGQSRMLLRWRAFNNSSNRWNNVRSCYYILCSICYSFGANEY